MSRRLDELSSAVIYNETMFRTPGPVQEHCISSRLVWGTNNSKLLVVRSNNYNMISKPTVKSSY